jgi:NitT/TauT family transport system substrate-binding protein
MPPARKERRWGLAVILAFWLVVACAAPQALTPVPAASSPPAQSTGATSAIQQPRPLRPLKISYATEASVTAPLWISKELGLFEKYGIDAELPFFRGSATNMQALLSGSVEMSLGGSSALIAANLAGADVRFLATTEVVATQSLVTKPTITEPSHLRGKTIVLGIAGGSSLPQLGEALRRMGLTAEDVQMLDIPLSNDRIAALVNGSVDAMVAPQAVTELALDMGFHLMMDMARAGIPNQGQSIIAPQRFTEQNRDLVKDVLRAFCEAIYLELTDKATAERVIGKWAQIDDPKALDAAYRASTDYLQPKPYASREGIQMALDELAPQNPEARNARPERFVDDSLLRELDREGFIDALWKR